MARLYLVGLIVDCCLMSWEMFCLRNRESTVIWTTWRGERGVMEVYSSSIKNQHVAFLLWAMTKFITTHLYVGIKAIITESSQAGVKAVAGALTQLRQRVVSLGIYEKIWCHGSGVGKLRIETSFCFLLVAYDLMKPDLSLPNCLGTPSFIPLQTADIVTWTNAFS